jgi:hypothetical protein
MRGHQIVIALVLGIPVAIIDERVELVTVVLAEAAVVSAAVGAPLVDVVAGVEDEVELLVGNAPERGEVAVFVMLAATDREPQTIHRRAGRRRRSGAAGLTDFIARAEAVPVLARRLEPRDLDVDAVAQFRPRRRGPLLHDVLEPRIVRDLPVDVHDGHRHAATVERLGREPRPQNDAVRQRIA